jgi:hypothetical protein
LFGVTAVPGTVGNATGGKSEDVGLGVGEIGMFTRVAIEA